MTRFAVVPCLLAVLLAAPALAGEVTMPILLEGTYVVHTASIDRAPDPVVLRVTDVAPLVAAERITDDRYDCHIWGSAILGKGGKRAALATESLYCYRKGGTAHDTLRFKAEGTILHPDGRAGIPARPTNRIGSLQAAILESGTKGIFTGTVSLEVCTPAPPPRASSLPAAEIRAAEPK
jgi:hypothetical protein